MPHRGMLLFWPPLRMTHETVLRITEASQDYATAHGPPRYKPLSIWLTTHGMQTHHHVDAHQLPALTSHAEGAANRSGLRRHRT